MGSNRLTNVKRWRAVLLLPLVCSAFGQNHPKDVELLPMPQLESLRGLSPEQRSAVTKRNDVRLRAWLTSLTIDLRAQWYASLGTADPRIIKRIGEKKLPSPASGYSWQVSARSAGLSDPEVAQLGREKVLIEDIAFKQAFEAYTKPDRPLFITTDSLLNAFHVLFEDSFHELEARRAFELSSQLENLMAKVRELMASARNRFSAAELAPGWRHAQLVVGTALRILGGSLESVDSDVRIEIDRQFALIQEAAIRELPPWLGPPSRTLIDLDYRRYRPVGFYTSTPSLQDYFRVVRWLQSIPFRSDRDVELTAIGLLAYAVMESSRSETRAFFRGYGTILGRPDDPSLDQAAYEFQNFLIVGKGAWSDALASKRRWLLRSQIDSGEFKKLNDLNRLPPDADDKLAEMQFRIISAHRLPESILFAQTAKSAGVPNGLAVAVLLGSNFARTQLADIAPDDLAAALKAAREDWQPTEAHRQDASIHDDYLRVLSALFDPAEPDSPEFMRGEAWAAKSCQTALASWAQMRHTFSLQAKERVLYAGLTDLPSGFVEPTPGFSSRLADLCERAAAQFEAGGAFLPFLAVTAEGIRQHVAFFRNLRFDQSGASAADLERLPPDQRRRYADELKSAGAYLPAWDRHLEPNPVDSEFQAFHCELIAALEREPARLTHESGPKPARNNLMRRRWEVMKTVTRRLEAIAHKQLRRQSWTHEEDAFIKSYGEQLAFVMGYYGNSWLKPRDDALRWATVTSDPRTDALLAIATGRARLLHVLYQWQDGEILCQGSVISYYEYSDRQRLTDEEWKAKLDSAAAPPQPGWIAARIAK